MTNEKALKALQITCGIVALLCLLLYTWWHTGALLARYSPWFIGYPAAFGIELAVVSLSFRIGQARHAKFFYFVLVAAVIVSALANVAEGFYTVKGVALTTATIDRLDALQWIIAIAATGLISLIVLALAEIVGSDATSAAPAAPVSIPVQAVTIAPPVSVTPAAEVVDAPAIVNDTPPVMSNYDAACVWLSGHPNAKPADLAAEFAISPRTASRWLDKWRGMSAKPVTNGHHA